MRRSLWGILALTLTLVLGACGGGGDDDAGITTTAGSTTTSPPATTTTTTSATTSQATTTTTTTATSTTSDVPVVTIPPGTALGTGDIQVTLIWDTDSGWWWLIS
jgi:ABC-type glycerol-3-phosphate transport system substrate-binding protein